MWITPLSINDYCSLFSVCGALCCKLIVNNKSKCHSERGEESHIIPLGVCVITRFTRNDIFLTDDMAGYRSVFCIRTQLVVKEITGCVKMVLGFLLKSTN